MPLPPLSILSTAPTAQHCEIHPAEGERNKAAQVSHEEMVSNGMDVLVGRGS